MSDGPDLLGQFPIRRAAVLSDDGLYRYELTRFWGDPGAFLQRHLSFVMLNPSKADADLDDPTIHRCCGFARRLGFDGIRVVNLYAYRATDPRDLATAMAFGDIVGPDNDRWLRKTLLRAYNIQDPVVCAWGLNAVQPRSDWLLRQARELCAPLAVLGLTQDGTPKHPLARGKSRIPDDAQLAPWPEEKPA